MSEVRTRIAPSPTGYPHIGTIYQALFDYVFAKKTNGKFIVRIEDTDRARFVEDAEKVVFESLDWFKLESDENPMKGGEYGPYRSSERLDLYKKYAEQLIKEDHAYYCFCTKERLEELRKKQESQKKPPMYDRFCLNLSAEEVAQKLKENIPYVVRMKVPKDQKIKVTDVLLGEVEFDSNLIDDQVLMKSDGFATYHLASTVDDYLMKITHVFRGQEWLPSYPKHKLLYEYLGWIDSMPQFVHLPVILNTEGGGKLSKRHGHASVDFYKSEGYLPEAILNYLSNIVWNHPEGKEIYPLMELAKAFKVSDDEKLDHIEIYSQGPRFDLNKLNWMNGEYIRQLSDEQLAGRLIEFFKETIDDQEKIKKLAPLVKERIKTLREFELLTDFLFEEVEYDLVVFGKINIDDLKMTLEKILEKFESLKKSWDAKNFEDTFRNLSAELKVPARELFQLIRVAISGKLVTPPLFESIEILGIEKTINRVKKALEFVS